MLLPQRLWRATIRGLARVTQIGSDPNDSDDQRLRQAITVGATLLGGIPVQIVIGTLMALTGEWVTAACAWAGATAMLVAFVAFASKRQPVDTLTTVSCASAFTAPFIGALALGGLANSGFMNLWGLIAALGALVTNRPRQALGWFGAFVASLLVTMLAQPYLRATNNLSPAVLVILSVVNVVGASSLIFVTLWFFVSQRDIAFRLLRGEQQKAESLLLNILPKDIAVILKNENRVIADHYEGASILFADVVDFTPLSAHMAPDELVQLLNEVFSHFDTLVERYGLEKIKTIGDCYMVAAGVPRPRSDHAHVLAQLALDIQECVSTRTFRGYRLAFRIGLNSGPVVAGVIGQKKFIYDLWGDAVNVASRMESGGVSGAIQITQSTYDVINDEFICEPRGSVSVKGKGDMQVWHVLGRKALA